MPYACKDRPPFEQSIPVQDGMETTWARRVVNVPFRMSPDCNYTTTELGKKDKACDGCKWKAGAGTDVASGLVQVGDSLADLRPGEGGPSSTGGQADVGGVADVAEQRRHLEQAGAAEKLEAIYPGAAMYRPINQCDGCQARAPFNDFGHHRYADGSLIACTANRYQPTEEK